MNHATAQEWLRAQSFANDGVAATYARGAVVVAVTLVQGRSQWQTENDEGNLLHADSADFFIVAAEIATIGVPKSGDKITVGSTRFDVMFAGQDHPWQWADEPNRTTYRIHTKQEGDV